MDKRKIMREILFRGKRTDNGEWVFGIFIPDALETVRGKRMLKGFIRNYDEDGDVIMYTVDRKSVGQYTGLNDMNGNRIFEGDIVRYNNKIYVMKYIEKYARFAPTNAHTVFMVCAFKQLEIIGNFYDNPELLEERFDMSESFSGVFTECVADSGIKML